MRYKTEIMETEDRFFKIATDAIFKEDSDLRFLFELDEDKYKKLHHGIGLLFETTHVFIIYKKLLSERFSKKVLWECSYPSNSRQHADLGIYSNPDDKNPTHLIEFKLLTKGEDSREILNDIQRLASEPEVDHKLLFIIYFDPGKQENSASIKEFLIDALKVIPNDKEIRLELLNDAMFKSKWYDDNHDGYKLINIFFLLFKISQ